VCCAGVQNYGDEQRDKFFFFTNGYRFTTFTKSGLTKTVRRFGTTGDVIQVGKYESLLAEQAIDDVIYEQALTAF